MLTLEIKNGSYGQYDKYSIGHIDYIKGYGSWQHPVGNDFSKSLTKDEAIFITEEIIKTLNNCLRKIGR